MHAARIAMLLAFATAPVAAWAGQPIPVMINCADAVGIPGGTASVTVSMIREGEALVVGTQNDLTFDDALFSIQRGDCVINPDIGPGTSFDKNIQQNVLADPPRVRALIVSLNNFTTIPPGLLYTCPFRVAADAPEGTYDIGNGNFVASTENGTRLPVSGNSCHIAVAAATQTPTPTPRCRENTDCPSGQVCVDGECVTATPTPTPIGFCEDNNDCPPGQVCVNHQCVTPTPTPVAPTRTNTPIGFCNDTEDCPPGQVCLNHECVTPTPTPQCRENPDCPSGQVCVDGTCVTATPTVTPTLTPKRSSGGGGCNCEIDPQAPASRTSDVLAVLLPALVLLLRWRRAEGALLRTREARHRRASGVAIDDQTVGWIVRRDGNGHLVARNDLDVVAPHPTADLGGELLSLLRLDAEQPASHDFFDRALDLNQIVSRHTVSPRCGC